LVVGLRLGCLNHALLSVAAINTAKVPFVGWIANQVDAEMAAVTENIATLKALINAPLLGVIPHYAQPDIAEISRYINFSLLLQITEAHHD
ncbi:MAG: AAA family ATPase, partial [Gammaproteobacteria bacterium]|nr:AAA family ATPase [Gammaproteobacteria bacterium]